MCWAWSHSARLSIQPPGPMPSDVPRKFWRSQAHKVAGRGPGLRGDGRALGSLRDSTRHRRPLCATLSCTSPPQACPGPDLFNVQLSGSLGAPCLSSCSQRGRLGGPRSHSQRWLASSREYEATDSQHDQRTVRLSGESNGREGCQHRSGPRGSKTLQAIGGESPL